MSSRLEFHLSVHKTPQGLVSCTYRECRPNAVWESSPWVVVGSPEWQRLVHFVTDLLAASVTAIEESVPF